MDSCVGANCEDAAPMVQKSGRVPSKDRPQVHAKNEVLRVFTHALDLFFVKSLEESLKPINVYSFILYSIR